MKLRHLAAALFIASLGSLSTAQEAEKDSPPRRERAPRVVSPEVAADRRITFRVHAPKAEAVRLMAGDIPGVGRGREMVKSAENVWELALDPVDPGAYRYRFEIDGVSTMDPANPAASESNASSWSLVVVPGSESMDARDVPHGAVAEVFYHSRALGRLRRMHVYTPPGYESGAGKYPVFYLLHGASDSDDSWTSVGRAGFILDNLIAAGKAKPMVVVMPAGHTGPFRMGARDPDAPRPAVDEFVEDFLKDIMPHVERNYRVLADRKHRAIAGLSMGGAQTLNIAIPNLEKFGHIGVFSSGVFGIAGGRGGGTGAGTSWEERNRAALENAELKKGLELVWFATGKEDFLIETSRATVALLAKHKFDVVFEETDGGHTWLKWRQYLIEFSGRLFSDSESARSPAAGPAADWPQWRGPKRDGISEEKGLLAEWPPEGPKLLWQAKGIGGGYSTPVVAGDRLFLLANEGAENEFVKALDAGEKGKEIWRQRIGKVGNPDQRPPYPAARSTPTVDGDLLYALGSDGDLVCLETAGGKERWRKSLRADHGGQPGTWAYAESPLIDGDILVCTPGGSTATMVALRKRDGEPLWRCAVPGGDAAGYASAIIVEAGGVKQYVQFVGKGLVGVEAKTGSFLWRYDKTAQGSPANIPTPVAFENSIYSGTNRGGGGLVKLIAGDGKFSAEEVYSGARLPTSIGGAVRIDGHLYGTTGQGLLCVEFASGEVKWQDRSIGAASVCYAEGRLYLHGENGDAALVEATPEGYREKGRFTPPGQPERGSSKAWAYPVVANGKLYLRDLDVLWCYDVKASGR